MMLRLGMPTLIELETLEENITLCKSLGLDFIEINLNMPQFQPHILSAQMLNDLQEKHQLFFTFHLAEDIDIGHFNPGIRKAYSDVILETLELMKVIHSPILNMHMLKGIHFTLPHKKVYLYQTYQEAYLASIIEVRDKISEALRGTQIKVMVENLGDFNHGFLQKSVETLLEDDAFRITYDIGHNHMSGDQDSAFLSQYDDVVQHYHIHDATREKDHLRLYDGELDIDGFLKRAAEKEATAVIEVKTVEALKDSIARLRMKKVMI